MTLPRFTSGKVGNLEFSHLNEAFDMLDGKQAKRADRRETQTASILAKLLQKNAANEFSWSEMARQNDGSYQSVTGGTSSTKSGNAFFYPAVSLSGGAVVGDTVILDPRRTKQGKLYYTIATSGGTITLAFQIVSSVAHASRPDMWSYVGKTVESVQTPGTGAQWVTTSQLEYVLLNGAENPTDGTSIGVGTVPPAGVISARRPIKPGTVVPASYIGNNWVFGLPNGYSFICQ